MLRVLVGARRIASVFWEARVFGGANGLTAFGLKLFVTLTFTVLIPLWVRLTSKLCHARSVDRRYTEAATAAVQMPALGLCVSHHGKMVSMTMALAGLSFTLYNCVGSIDCILVLVRSIPLFELPLSNCRRHQRSPLLLRFLLQELRWPWLSAALFFFVLSSICV